jgi:hypothetical protein
VPGESAFRLARPAEVRAGIRSRLFGSIARPNTKYAETSRPARVVREGSEGTSVKSKRLGELRHVEMIAQVQSQIAWSEVGACRAARVTQAPMLTDTRLVHASSQSAARVNFSPCTTEQ